MLMLILFLTLLLVLIYLYFKIDDKYWKKRGVPQAENASKLFGCYWKLLSLQEPIGETYKKIYDDFKEFPYVGIYHFTKPALLLRDPELIKNVLVKDFKSFRVNDIFVPKRFDAIFGENPFCLQDLAWKTSRNQVTPSLTSGKLKHIFDVILSNVNKNLHRYLEKRIGSEEGVNVKELSHSYCCDVVAEAAMGVRVDAINDPKSTFKTLLGNMFPESVWGHFSGNLIFLYPYLSWLLGKKMFSNELTGYVKNIVDQAVNYRRTNNVNINDYLGRLMETKDKFSEAEFEDQTLYGLVGVLLLNGIETSALPIQLALLELALNPKIQERLREEIDEVWAKCRGQFKYDNLQEMSYLDCVYRETLRKYPPLHILGKMVAETYTFKTPDHESTVENGTPVVVPIFALHLDPNFYPNPQLFDPDRFLDGNQINNDVYLPFSSGPRICLGKRFAEMQGKFAIMSVIKNYEILPGKRTNAKIEYEPLFLVNSVKGALWLNLRKRKTESH